MCVCVCITKRETERGRGRERKKERAIRKTNNKKLIIFCHAKQILSAK